MNKTIRIFVVMCFLGANLKAQRLYHPQSIASGNMLASSQNIAAVFGNPANLTQNTKRIGTFAAIVPVGVRNLESAGFGAVLPNKSGTFGFSYFSNGSTNVLNERKIAVAFAKNLSSKLNMGIRFRMNLLRAAEYGQITYPDFDIGFNYLAFNKLHIYFVGNPKIGGFKIYPSVFALGTSYSINPRVKVSAEIEKESFYKENIKFGIDYQLVKNFTFRAGINTQTMQFTLGYGYAMSKRLSLDFAFQTQSNVGALAAFSLNSYF